MDIPEVDHALTADDQDEAAPWGTNPATGRPYTRSPEERARIGQQLAAARAAKAAERQAAGGAPPAEPGEATPVDRSAPDREPGRPRGRRARGRTSPKPAPSAEVPPFKAGPIAKGMNRLYAKAGKILRLVNHEFGTAFIACTRKESEDDLTVGEAWEELAKVNPRWRGWLLKMVTGGAAGQVVMAHAPILLAMLMLDPVRRRVPFGGLVDAVLSPDDGAPADPNMPTGMDMESMMAAATAMMGPLFAQRAASMPSRTPDLNGMWPAGAYPDEATNPAEAAA